MMSDSPWAAGPAGPGYSVTRGADQNCENIIVAQLQVESPSSKAKPARAEAKATPPALAFGAEPIRQVPHGWSQPSHTPQPTRKDLKRHCRVDGGAEISPPAGQAEGRRAPRLCERGGAIRSTAPARCVDDCARCTVRFSGWPLSCRSILSNSGHLPVPCKYGVARGRWEQGHQQHPSHWRWQRGGAWRERRARRG